MGLGHAFEMDPATEGGFLLELAQAQMAREIFPERKTEVYAAYKVYDRKHLQRSSAGCSVQPGNSMDKSVSVADRYADRNDSYTSDAGQISVHRKMPATFSTTANISAKKLSSKKAVSFRAERRKF